MQLWLIKGAVKEWKIRMILKAQKRKFFITLFKYIC